jgi:hypothetical protein
MNVSSEYCVYLACGRFVHGLDVPQQGSSFVTSVKSRRAALKSKMAGAVAIVKILRSQGFSCWVVPACREALRGQARKKAVMA